MSSSRHANISEKLTNELIELSEETDFSRLITKAMKFYLKALKLKKDGRVIIAVPWEVNENGDFIPDKNKLKNLIVLEE